MQSIPGANLAANFSVPTATVAQSLGRPLAGNAAFATVNLVTPGALQGDRINQLDLRVDKTFTFNRWKLLLYLDLENVYAAQSAEGVAYNYNFTKPEYLSGLPFLPAISLGSSTSLSSTRDTLTSA